MTEFDDDLYEERAKVLDCGCVLIANLLNHDMKIVYCPTHAAAPALYEENQRIANDRRIPTTFIGALALVEQYRKWAKDALSLVYAKEAE